MALNFVSPLEFKVEGIPDFDTVTFTSCSKKILPLPLVLQFVNNQNSILQSALEAAVFRMEANGKYDSKLTQITRTTAVYFSDGNGNVYVAIDDTPDEEKNIILARGKEGYQAHRSLGKWELNKTDKDVSGLLKRAEKDDHIIKVPEKEVVLDFYSKDGWKSEFAKNKIVKAILGNYAEPYARWMRTKYYPKSKLHLGYCADWRDEIKWDAEKVSIKAVGFLGKSGVLDPDIYVNMNLDRISRSRGVKQQSR